MAAKKVKYLFDGIYEKDGRYVRAFNDGRTEIAVQVWNKNIPEGEPTEDWAMPKILGLTGCIEQALAQTPKPMTERKGKKNGR